MALLTTASKATASASAQSWIMFFMAYTSAPLGMSATSKNEPPTNVHRAATPGPAASSTAGAPRSTCRWSKSVPCSAGFRFKIDASSVPVPPPTSTTVDTFPPRVQSKSSAALPASRAYALTAAMEASNRAPADGFACMYSKKPVPLAGEVAATGASKSLLLLSDEAPLFSPSMPPPLLPCCCCCWAPTKSGLPVCTAVNNPPHACPSSRPENMAQGRMEPTASSRSNAPSGVRA
mmetsp:Transcript_83178/g.161885  ORF Transcript_83178/g.161885 Transcript_83178/m.161885 type:complete len:235 (-) Transcript_83178:615-1319(-)